MKKHITLYRNDFRINPDDGTLFFEDVLFDLNIIKELWDDIDSLEIGVGGVDIFDDDGNDIG